MAKKKLEIVTYDAATSGLYQLKDSIVSELDGKCMANYIISYLPAVDLKYALIESSADSESGEEELIGNKAYEAMDLDIELDYQIRYALAETVSSNEAHQYNVFAAQIDTIESCFKAVARRVSYIDYIDFEPMLYSAYYQNNTFSSLGTHIYLYFHKSYATLTIYKNGQLCSFRCLNKLSFESLHAAFCHEVGERIAEHTFLQAFAQYGFAHPESDKRVAMNKVFAQACMLLANNINFALRSLKIEGEPVSMVAVGSDLPGSKYFLPKFKTMFANFKNIDVDMLLEAMLEDSQTPSEYALSVNNYVDLADIKCDLFKNIKSFINEAGESKLTPLNILLFMRANELLKAGDDTFNASVFLRPPPLFKRPSGKLILSLIAPIVLVGAYPAYNFAQGFLLDKETEEIKEQIPAKQSEYNTLKNRIDGLKQQINQANERIQTKEENLQSRQDLLEVLFDKKVNYAQKAQMIVDITKQMNLSRVHIEDMQLDQDKMLLKVLGSNVAVSEFIKALGSKKKYNIRSNEINISRANKEFGTDLEIRIKR